MVESQWFSAVMTVLVSGIVFAALVLAMRTISGAHSRLRRPSGGPDAEGDLSLLRGLEERRARELVEQAGRR